MLRRLPIELAEVKAGNTSEKLLNKIWKLFLLTKKLIKNYNSKNSKTSDPHRLLHYITDKIDLKRTDKYITLSYHALYMEKYKKDI